MLTSSANFEPYFDCEQYFITTCGPYFDKPFLADNRHFVNKVPCTRWDSWKLGCGGLCSAKTWGYFEYEILCKQVQHRHEEKVGFWMFIHIVNISKICHEIAQPAKLNVKHRIARRASCEQMLLYRNVLLYALVLSLDFLFHSFIHPSIHSFIHSFNHSQTHSFIHYLHFCVVFRQALPVSFQNFVWIYLRIFMF